MENSSVENSLIVCLKCPHNFIFYLFIYFAFHHVLILVVLFRYLPMYNSRSTVIVDKPHHHHFQQTWKNSSPSKQ